MSFPRLFAEQKEMDTEKHALRVLLDSFRADSEAELTKLLADEHIQRNIGRFIAQCAVSMVKQQH